MMRLLSTCFSVFLALWLSGPDTLRADPSPISFQAASTADGVSIRAEPSDQSPLVGRVWHGVGLRVKDLQAGWFLVEAANGKTGWIRCEYLETAAPSGGTAVPAAATPATVAESPGPAAPPATPEKIVYRIQPGDELGIKSFRFPELKGLVTVRPDGYISLVLLDDIHVQGMTLDDLDMLLTERYKKYFKNPDVTVVSNMIRLVSDRMVFIGGEVERPMERPLQTPITVLQAIVAAGGFKVGAKANNVMLIRKDKDGRPLFYKLDLSDVKYGQPIPDNVYLQPFDVVYVPSTAIAKAGDFVKQYVNNIIPQAVTFGVNWIPAL